MKAKRKSAPAKGRAMKSTVVGKSRAGVLAKRAGKTIWISRDGAPVIKTRASLVGTRIYAATVKPSSRVKAVIASLAQPDAA